MKTLEKIKKFGKERFLKNLKRLSEQEFEEKVLQKNIFKFLNISSLEEMEEIENLKNCYWFTHECVEKIMPKIYKNMDWAISSEGIFDFD